MNKNLNVRFDATMDIGGMKQSLGQLNNLLNTTNVKLPKNISSNLSKLVNTLGTELNKIESLDGQIMDSKKVKQLGSSYEKISSTFQQVRIILKDLQKNAGIDFSKFFPDSTAKQINGITEAIEKYKKAIEQGPKDDGYKAISQNIKDNQKRIKELRERQNEQEIKQQAALLRKRELQEEQANKKSAKNQADAEADRAKKQLDVVKSQTRTLKQQDALRKKIAEAREKEDKATERATHAQEEMLSKKRTDTKIYSDLERKYESNNQEAERAKNTRVALEQELKAAETAQQRIAEATERKNRAQEASARAAKEVKSIEEQIGKQDKAIGEATANFEALATGISEAEAKSAQFTTQLEEQKRSFEQQSLEVLVSEIKELGITIPEASRNLEGINKILDSLSIEAKEKLSQALRDAGISAENLGFSLDGLGGKNRYLQELENAAERSAREMNNLKDNILSFFSVANVIQIFKDAVHDAFDTIKELDAAMTETAVVTDFSIGDMWEKLPEYSKQATKLGSSIKSLYEATTLYYQQGLNSQQAMNVGIETMKMARIANMDAEAATTAMTAALRGFNMEINELSAQRINDVYSELAAVTAADTSQIAAAMSKTASIASSANMEFETTAALLAQIIETTQEAPETAGTAMKTIIARFTEVKKLFSQGMLTGEDEEGEVIDINKIDTALKTVGISLKDFLNGSKGIDDIFLELASKWDTLDLATQRYIATTAAGSRQQSRFLAMMSNYDRTMELVNAATNSAGASQKQFEKTLDSLEAKLQRLSNAWDTFTMGLANNEIVKFGVDLLTNLLELANGLTDDLGSTAGAVAKLGLALTTLKSTGNIFNSMFVGSAEAGEEISKISPKAQNLTNVLGKMGIKVKDLSGNFEEENKSLVKAREQTAAWGSGLQKTGLVLGVFGEYLRQLGYDTEASFLQIGGAITALTGSTISSLANLATALNTSIGSLLASFAAAIPWVIVLGAAIGSVIGVLKYFYDNSTAGKLKAAQKDTEKAAEAAQEAADAYNNLKNALSGIEDKTSALSELTKGTNEWREAVLALNNEVLDLIQTYPELAAFVSNKGGVLTIDYETTRNINGKEQTAADVLEQYSKAQLQAQQIYLNNQIKEKEAERNDSNYSNKALEDFAKQLEVTNEERARREQKGKDLSTFKNDVIKELTVALQQGEVDYTDQAIKDYLGLRGLGFKLKEDGYKSSFLREYNQYLEKHEAALNTFTDGLVSASMALADLKNISSKGNDFVQATNPEILRGIYKGIQDNTLKTSITQKERDEYAKSMGYTSLDYMDYAIDAEGNIIPGSGKKATAYFSDPERTQPVTITDVEVGNYLANKQFESILQTLGTHYDNATGSQQGLLEEVFNDNQLSRETLKKYASYNEETGFFNLAQEELENFIIDMGFEGFDDLKNKLNLELEDINAIFTNSGAQFIDIRKNLIKNMSKLSKHDKLKDLDFNAELLSGLEEKYADIDLASILSSVFEKLGGTGDSDLSTAAYESLREIMLEAKSSTEIQDAFDFINQIDFNNPINALETINEEIKNGKGYSQQLATSIKEANSSFLGMSSQISSLTKMEDFEDLKEDLQEVLDANNEIAAQDVLELSKSYKSLDKILKNNEVTAYGLGKALEKITDGTLAVEELTDTVLAAVSAMGSLESIVAGTVQNLEDFDLGVDENKIGETAKEWSELILENIKKGAVGNAQNFKILDYLFPGWSEDLEGDEIVVEMKRLAKKLQGNGQNLRAMWSDLAKEVDFQGKKREFTTTTDAKFKDLDVNDTGKEITFTGWEGKGLTSQDLVDWISDAYNVSTELASMMLSDFKNYSTDLAAELRVNDLAIGIEKAYQSLHQYGEIKFIDEKELETIANILGTDKGSVLEAMQAYGTELEETVQTTNFYDKDGVIKSFKDINEEISKIAKDGGKAWRNSFTKEGILNLSDLEESLSEIGIVGANAEEIKKSAFESVRDGIQEGTAEIYTTLSSGEKIPIEVTPKMSYEDFKKEIQKADTQDLNNNLADAIGKSVSSYLNEVKVTPTPSENSLSDCVNKIKEAIETEPYTTSIVVSQSSLEAARNAIIKKLQNKIAVGIILDKAESSDEGFSYPQGDVSSTWTSANGLVNSPRSGTSLVSEEGPELIQKAKGGAYLTGQNGPEMVHIDKGDTVYTAQQTKKILKSRNHKIFPRFEPGLNNDGKASAYGNGAAYGGGAGGKSNSENTLDKLYNLLKEIEAEGRQRERIERRYQYLIESVDSSVNDLIKVSSQELEVLERQRQMQENLRSRRRDQISLYQQENADLQKYAWFEKDPYGEDILQIDWQAIEAITDKTLGERVGTYVEQLEEWSEAIYNVEQELYDIEDQIKEIKERGREEYLEYEERIRDALVDSYEKEIEQLETINDSIVNTNNSVIKSIQNRLSESRKQRENQKTEQSIADKERRLAYLRQDTSGANALEILQLEKELQEDREGYIDTLIDDKIVQLQNQNDKAAEQRTQQIDIARAQLNHLVESGQMWKEVESLMAEGLDKEHGLIRGSRLESILKSSEGFKGMSETQKVKWLEELEQDSKVVVAYIEGLKQEAKKPVTVVDNNDYSGSSGGKTPNSSSGGGGSSGNGGNGGDGPKEVIYNPQPAKDYVSIDPDKDLHTIDDAQMQKPKGYKVTLPKYNDFKGGTYSAPTSPIALEKARQAIEKFEQEKLDSFVDLPEVVRKDKLEKLNQTMDYLKPYSLKAVPYYLHGGLADFTGPAWLDGSKAKPEYVLNASQTQGFLKLVDILDTFRASSYFNSQSQKIEGDTFDIDINIETVKEEADIDMITEKVQKAIVSTSKYRSNNFVKR